MNIFKADKLMDRLDQMIENAYDGKPIQNNFDESKVSALETKLSHFLAMNGASCHRITEEKAHINQLISDISHQTKTPIANILLYSQLLAESNLSETDRDCVEALTAQAEKLNFLIGSLVKTSRLETGIIAVKPVLQPIFPLLHRVMEEVKAKANKKQISITCCETDVSAVFDLKWTGEALGFILQEKLLQARADTSSLAQKWVSVLFFQYFYLWKIEIFQYC